ncbi:MAG: heavy-metal-associated domain-containing protein [Chloroflexi bacterium]|nr:heavy-metal-associated domain-containing protein [Chloroflexota bacterium]
MSCIPRVNESAKRVDGVEKVQVDLRSQTVTVTYDASNTNSEAIAQALKAGGDTIAKVETQ